jgi:5-methylcytosine-specific restriction endonuclease McrA
MVAVARMPLLGVSVALWRVLGPAGSCEVVLWPENASTGNEEARKTACYDCSMSTSIAVKGTELGWARVAVIESGARGRERRGSRHYAIRRPTLFLVRDGADGTYGQSSPQARAEPETVSDWAVVHEHMLGLGVERAAHEHELGRWLRAAERLGVHARTGHASLYEYAERILGLTRRQVEERLRVARALDELPVLEEALASGKLCFSSVRELTRVATPETEQAWLDWAKGRLAKQIEQAIATRHPGDWPHDRADRSLVRHRLSFEVRAETMALFRDLAAKVRMDLGGAADDDALVYEIARRGLGGPTDEGRASYQVAVTRCPDCGRTSLDGGGASHEVGSTMAEMVACDCQEIGEVDCPHVGAAATDCPHVGAAAADGPRVGAPATNRPHVGAAAEDPRRATQTIPPAVRRQVMRRDHGHCVVEGCRNHRFVDVHHVVPRAEGGRHDPDQMAVVCGAHHRALHGGTLVMQGAASTGFTFRHADGTPYGNVLRPPTAEAAAQVFGALRNLGFNETRARALVDAVLRAGAPADAAAFLRAALGVAYAG